MINSKAAELQLISQQRQNVIMEISNEAKKRQKNLEK